MDGEGYEHGGREEAPLLVAIGDVDATEPDRFPSGDAGLDFVLGGGLVPGSIVAIFGPPGVGKSSLLTKVAASVADHTQVIYAAGEESAKRVARRVRRLKLFKKYPNAHDNLTVMENANDTDVLCGLIIEESPLLTIVDSFGSLESERASPTARPGGPSQVAYAAKMLADVARTTGRSIIAIGHETKDGSMAGPSIARHEVDTLLAMEHVEIDEDGNPGKKADKQTGWVRLRADGKNRDGDTSATAIYRMTEKGLVGVDELDQFQEDKLQDQLQSKIREDKALKEKRNEAAASAGTRRRTRKVDGDSSAGRSAKKTQASRVERSVSSKQRKDLGPVRAGSKRSRSGEAAARS
jgi:DNA repair protein RadA/Sms